MKRYTLTVRQAAEQLRISPARLYEKVGRREIACYRTSGRTGRLYFAQEDIDAYIAAGVTPALETRPPAPPQAFFGLPEPKRRRFS